MSVTAPTMPDFCYVENQTDQEYVLKYEFQPYRFPPGERHLAPRAAINVWFGDPDLADHPTDPRRKSRTEAARVCATRWGIFRDKGFNDPATGESRFPTGLRAFDFEGNPLPTIHIDPEGKMLNPVDENETAQADLAAQVQKMSRALAQLQAQAAEQGVDLTQQVTVADTPDPAPEIVNRTVEEEPSGGATPDSSSTPKPKGRKKPAPKVSSGV